jgi:hypothetical protein
MLPEIASVLLQESNVASVQGVFVEAVMELHTVRAPVSGFKVGSGKAGGYRCIGNQLRVIQYKYGHLKILGSVSGFSCYSCPLLAGAGITAIGERSISGPVQSVVGNDLMSFV